MITEGNDLTVVTWGGMVERCEEAATELGQKPGDIFMLCRVAVTGRAVTRPLFESMTLIGRERSIERLDAARVILSS